MEDDRGGDGSTAGKWKAVIPTSLLGRMGDQKKEGAGAGEILARGGSTEAAGKSRVDLGRGRGMGDQPCNKFPSKGRQQRLRGRRRRLRSAPLASGAWGRSQGRQHCGAIKETGSALTAAGNSGPGVLPGAGQSPAAAGPAPRGGSGAALGKCPGRGRNNLRSSPPQPPGSPAGGWCHLGFSSHELQPEWCLLTNSSQK